MGVELWRGRHHYSRRRGGVRVFASHEEIVVSKAKIAIGVGVAVWGFIMLAVGKVWRNAEGEAERKKMNTENEELRKNLRSVLRTFEAEMGKKDQEIQWFEKIIDQLIKVPPANKIELVERLRFMDLTNSEFELVMLHTAPVFED